MKVKTITFDEGKYQLVPIEPTQEMLDRGHHMIDFHRCTQNTFELSHESQTSGSSGTTIEQDMRDAWKTMLVLAPNTESSDETTKLAQLVADMPPLPTDEKSIEAWAKALAADISKGNK